MTDPRAATERHDPTRITSEGEPKPDIERDPGEPDRGNDLNDLDADNAVEEDTIETVDPDNAPA